MLALARPPLAAPHPDPGHAVDRTAAFLWYTLSVIPQSQIRVCRRAKELGIETYCPMSRTPPQVRKFGRPRVVAAEVRPLMPGYAFVALPTRSPRFDLFQRAEAVLGCLGFLRSPDGPMAVSEAVIEDMRLRERNGEFDLTGLSEDGRHRVPRWAKRSTVVEFIGGPFEGFPGVVVKALSAHLIEVAVDILGVSNVRAPLDWIRIAR